MLSSPSLYSSYHPFHFLHGQAAQLADLVRFEIEEFDQKPNHLIETVEVDGKPHQFLVQHLPWDTKFFGMDTYRLQFVLYAHQDTGLLRQAVAEFIGRFLAKGRYCFIEVPAEDIRLIHALTSSGFALVETRLTYYRSDPGSFEAPHYAVRVANENDIANLKNVARVMRNPYDRFHADPAFTNQMADEFLATYIEQSVKGYADHVIVPAEEGTPADSFLTGKYLKDAWKQTGMKASKMVLSAVSSNTNKGWYKKLIAEMTRHLHENGAEYIFMNTQSTNVAVIHTWESLGYRLGYTSYILSFIRPRR